MKIGLVIMLVENRELGRAPTYPEIREMALRAERDGFDAIWLYDHLMYEREGQVIGIWECWTVLSALAEATQRVELGTLVLCNQFRNPAILAKMAATLEEVSGGRLVLGIGAGWNEPEFKAFGIPFDHRVSRFEEALQIIRPLSKEGQADFQGQYYQANDCPIRPRGPRPEGPPILVGGEGPRMLRLTARYAELWNVGYLGKPQTLEKYLPKLHEACAEEGRDPATLGVTVMIALAFPDLGGKPQFTEDYLTGSPEEIAEALHGYKKMRVEHLMFHLLPYTHEALDQLTAALHIYRGEAGGSHPAQPEG
jgi:probable F420-dependent oxidoreductase